MYEQTHGMDWGSMIYTDFLDVDVDISWSSASLPKAGLNKILHHVSKRGNPNVSVR